MTPITTPGIQNEIDEIENVADFINILDKYPSRVRAKITITVDNCCTAGYKHIYLDSNCKIVVE